MPASIPPVALFGYHSSPFTQKVRLVLSLRQIPYTFVLVPSMMPRPILLENFNLTYRKIPVLSIGKELYVDTSLIIEVLATHPAFPPSERHPALHPDERTRTLSRILSSFYTDRPLFRLTTGLIPPSVWRTSFGEDRAGLIGHKLNPAKLGAKVTQNLSGLDTFLSMLEPSFSPGQDWFLGTSLPSLADIALYYQLDWGEKISRGEGIENLTGGGTADGAGEGMLSIFNKTRYPGIVAWFHRFRKYFDSLPQTNESRIEEHETSKLAKLILQINTFPQQESPPMLPTSTDPNAALDARNGLRLGVKVSIAPADTGRGNPTIGQLVGISTEEVVIVPESLDGIGSARVQGVRIHFPRIEFLVKALEGVKAKL